MAIVMQKVMDFCILIFLPIVNLETQKYSMAENKWLWKASIDGIIYGPSLLQGSGSILEEEVERLEEEVDGVKNCEMLTSGDDRAVTNINVQW